MVKSSNLDMTIVMSVTIMSQLIHKTLHGEDFDSAGNTNERREEELGQVNEIHSNTYYKVTCDT